MNTRIQNLLCEYPLPCGWSAPSVHPHQLNHKGLEVELLGLITQKKSVSLFASAGERLKSPTERAFFELYERVSIVEAESNPRLWQRLNRMGEPQGTTSHADVFPQSPNPKTWQYSKSNGVALGLTFDDACFRAHRELFERSCILRSWFGHFKPLLVPMPPHFYPKSLMEDYEILSFQFSKEPDDIVTGIFMVPRLPNIPLAYGFGAAPNLESSLEKSRRELDQRLGFLWGEELPSTCPEFSPTSYFHQEYFLQPQMSHSLKKWLLGERKAIPLHLPYDQKNGSYSYVDITPDLVKDKIYVVRALHEHAMPLTFGVGHPWIKANNLPEDLKVHPIA